ncbi:MAG TPA: sigma-70 family RNA polymerase sigma factor [Longimicrobiales bacterium]|nr:sigma-70 family RNA polymerase sigma factor [Longimicrobiales bacterium]
MQGEAGRDTRDDGAGEPIETHAARRSAGAAPHPGDGPDAWLIHYRELGEPVFRLLHRMTGDEDLARDLTHDTFVRAFERADQYAGTGALKGWIFRIAANLVRERARTARRRSGLLERERADFERSARSPAERIESRMVLEEALTRLPEEQRITLLLYEVDGYTHAEIAEMTGVAEGSSKARVSRAKAALREALDGRI